MRILFYPRNLDSGDSQRSAVEMAGAMVAAGYQVSLLGGPGLLMDRARELGIDVVSIPASTGRCVLRSVLQLSKVVRDREIDVVHAFEWESIAKAFIVTKLRRTGAAVTGTVHSRCAPPVLPRTVPLLMGSRSEAADRRTAGYTRVGVLEPWVNTSENHPMESLDATEIKTRWGFDGDGLLITVVTATEEESSTGGLATVVVVVDELAAQGLPVQLLVIGDGPRRVLADERAAELNHKFGRTVVVAAGELLDRHEAFVAADVVIGSDSSLLHGMAFAKPVVVEGAQGYFRAVNHATAEQFLWTGWYGIGSGARTGKAELLSALEPLLDSARLREYRGVYSRQLAENYGLDGAVLRQLQEYRDALDTKVGRISTGVDLGRVTGALVVRRARRQLRMSRWHRKPQYLREPVPQVSSAPSPEVKIAGSVGTHEGSGYDGSQ